MANGASLTNERIIQRDWKRGGEKTEKRTMKILFDGIGLLESGEAGWRGS